MARRRYSDFYKPQPTASERREKSQMQQEKLRKKGENIRPIIIEGRKISKTFWGNAWCRQMESFSDYSNRLPRGRSYVRNGTVCHLEILPQNVKAMVSGSKMYEVNIKIKPYSKQKWKTLKNRCQGNISSLVALLKGELSEEIMELITEPDSGLFPQAKEIAFGCSCPDWASMCKHISAVLYGIGNRLDEEPELLFVLRGVDYKELVNSDINVKNMTRSGKSSCRRRFTKKQLGELFDI